jgi:uncharacterized protein YprB with RNaseH-like and TPR domain
MRLRDRLTELSRPMPPTAVAASLESGVVERSDQAERAERIERLRALIGGVVARGNRQSSEPASIGRGPGLLPVGEQRHTEHGPLHIVERWLEPGHTHGRVAVRGALGVESALLARLALDPALERVDLARMLILDTETTGLSGGTGTVPFLIGLCFFEDGALKLEQLFLGNLGGEAPLLRHLADRIAGASCLVSYNGKAFDWPLLRARFVLNRIPLPPAPPHLDLLHCARRVLRPRLASVRLCEVERALLGFYREDDVDGAEIPGLYLRYLRGADPRTLLPVLQHNEHDLVALAAVLWRLCAHFASVQREDDPRDHLAYAKLALRAGDLERAHEFAEAAAAGASAEVAYDALAVVASAARLRGDSQAALLAWRRALHCADDELPAARARLALARLCERKLKDLAQAYQHARFTLPAEGPDAQGRRLGRLVRKLERAAAQGR